MTLKILQVPMTPVPTINDIFCKQNPRYVTLSIMSGSYCSENTFDWRHYPSCSVQSCIVAAIVLFPLLAAVPRQRLVLSYDLYVGIPYIRVGRRNPRFTMASLSCRLPDYLSPVSLHQVDTLLLTIAASLPNQVLTTNSWSLNSRTD